MSEKAVRTLARYQEVVRACAVMNFRQVTRAVTAQFDDALRPAGLRATQLNLLVVIEGAFANTVTELAAILAMDRTTMTRNLKLLRARAAASLSPTGSPSLRRDERRRQSRYHSGRKRKRAS